MAHSRLCSIPDCGKPHEARGWCKAHYARWSLHGDPLSGGTVRGEPQRYLRDIVLRYDGEDCLIWPYAKDGPGYGKVWLEGKLHVVSRLVCEETNGPPPTPEHEAAHSCGNGHLACVTKGHLSWKTQIENGADKLLHDTVSRGERQGSSKLTEADAVQIRDMKGSLSQRAIAEKFGVTQSAISDIHRGVTWSWLR